VGGAVGVGALAGALGYILVSNPADTRPDTLGGCSWYALFGTNGPTCGGTRMMWYLLHGDLVNAARMHLIALLGTPFALYALTAWAARTVFGRRLPRLPLRGWMIVTYVVVFIVYGAVLRNLPALAWFHLKYMQPGIGL
jgi:drug/metabolite transporter (DMT)-like permease